MRDASVLTGELQIAGRLDARFFALLEALDATGSLRKAASAAGYSYKGAWLLLEAAGELAHQPLLETTTGGVRGGGTRLTDAARALLCAWCALQQRHEAFLREQEARLLQEPAFAGLMRRFGLMSSARNQFAGRVLAVHREPGTTQVSLQLDGGLALTAAMTAEAADRLQLQVGQAATALIKSSDIVLVVDFDGFELSARNQWPGTISRVEPGATSSLVGLTLPGGATVTASAPNDAVVALGLAIGQPATAVFKAHSVLVAVPAR